MGEEVPAFAGKTNQAAGVFKGRSPLGEGVLEDPAETGLQVGGPLPLPTTSGGLTPKNQKNAEKT